MAKKFQQADLPETLTTQALQAIGRRRPVVDGIRKRWGIEVQPSTVSKWAKRGGLPVGNAAMYAPVIARLARRAGLDVTSRDLIDEAIVPGNRVPAELRP